MVNEYVYVRKIAAGGYGKVVSSGLILFHICLKEIIFHIFLI